MNLSASDIRCVQFARLVQDCGGADPVFPRLLAELCVLARKAHAAGVRECNVPDYKGGDKARERVETHAAAMGWRTEWPGLYPSFTIDANRARFSIPA